MLVKRLALIVISLILGMLVTWLIISLFLETSIAEYGGLYFSLTSFFFGAFFGVWLDKFLDTNMLPE